jgi:hypothetical protein
VVENSGFGSRQNERVDLAMARPGRKCRICASPLDCAKVDALISSGETLRAVASLTGFDRFSISRHKRHAFAQPESEPELDELQLSEQRLKSLADRLEMQYTAAIASADGKLGVDILKMLSRVESERHRRIIDKRQAEVDAPKNPETDCGSPEFHDALLRKFEQLRVQERALGKVSCPFCGSDSPNSFMFPKDIRVRMLQIMANEGFLVTAPAAGTEEQNVNDSAAN